MRPKDLIQPGFETLIAVPGFRSIAWLFAKKFVAGEHLEDLIAKTEELRAMGFHVIADHLGEDAQTREEISDAARVCELILQMAEIYEQRIDIALKPSQLGMREEFSTANFAFRESVAELSSLPLLADSKGFWPWLDAETLKFRRATWDFGEWMLSWITFIGIAFQTYGEGPDDSYFFLRDRIIPLIQRLPAGKTLGLRLCMGAYDEEHSIKNKKLAHHYWLACAEMILTLMASYLSCGERPPFFLEFATHDPRRIEYVRKRVKELGIPHEFYRFAMLYGRQRSYAAWLLAEGENVAIYLPVGKDWLPYFTRRLYEKPEYILLPFLALREGDYNKPRKPTT